MTNTLAPKAPATDSQISYLTTLLKQRVIPEGYADLIVHVENRSIGKLEASLFIDKLRDAKWKPREVAPAQGMYTEVPVARYALSFEELGNHIPNLPSHGNDYLFFRISEHRGRRRIVRLHGAVGSFTSSYISRKDGQSLVNMIKDNPAEYSRKFGELFTCCGACLAPLTDVESRRIGFGPTCRGRFSL